MVQIEIRLVSLSLTLDHLQNQSSRVGISLLQAFGCGLDYPGYSRSQFD